MNLTRQHFQMIADTIREVQPGPTLGTVQTSVLIARFADKLAATNCNFDRERFIEACQA